jgi:hypothetical protein
MHPEVIGRGHRMTMLDGLIAHMKAQEGVTFTTYLDYAIGWREQNPLDDWTRANPIRTGARAIEAL